MQQARSIPFIVQEPLDGRIGQVTRQQGSRTDSAATFHMSLNDGPFGVGEGVSRVVHIVGLGPQRIAHSAWQGHSHGTRRAVRRADRGMCGRWSAATKGVPELPEAGAGLIRQVERASRLEAPACRSSYWNVMRHRAACDFGPLTRDQ